ALLPLLHRPPDPRGRALDRGVHRRPHRDGHAPDLGIPRGGAAVGGGARRLPRRQPAGARRGGEHPARGADQRRREHALHVLASDRRRRAHAHRDVPHRHRPRPRAGAGAEPREPGAAAAPGGGAAARRDHGQELARPHDGGAPRLARRAVRHDVPAQLRDAPGEGPARAHPGRGAGDLVRRGRLRDARLARPAEGGRARALGRRRGGGDPRAEPAGGRGRGGRAADARARGLPAHRERARAARRRGGVRRDHRPRRPRRRAHAAARRGPHRAGRRRLRAALAARQQGRRRAPDLPGAGLQRAAALDRRARDDGGAQEELPAGRGLLGGLRPHDVRARLDPRGGRHAVRGDRARGDRRRALPPDVARVGDPAARRAGVDRGHAGVHARLRLLDQHALALRPRAGGGDRGGRRHRGRGERRAQHRARDVAAGGELPGDERGERADRRDRARAVRGVRPDRLRERAHRPVLPAVRAHDRVLHAHLGVQLAHALPRAVGDPAQAARRAARPPHAGARPRARVDLPPVQPLLRAGDGRLRAHRGDGDPALGLRARRLRGADRLRGGRVPAGAHRLRPHAGQAVPRGVRPAPRRRHARPHRGRGAAHGRDRAQARGRAQRDPVPGALDQRLRELAQRGDRLLRPRRLRGAHRRRAVRAGDRRRAHAEARRDRGRLHRRVPAAAGAGAGHGGRVQARARGPRVVRRGGARPRRAGARRPRFAGAVARRRVLGLPDQRAAALRRRRPREGEAPGDRPHGPLPDAADLPGLRLRERLLEVRAHLPRDRAGRRALPGDGRGDRAAAGAQRRRGDDPARLRAHGHPDERAGPGAALQRVPCGGHQRRAGAGRELGAGRDDDGAHRARGAAERRGVRVDRAHLPADPRGEHHADRLPAVRAPGVPRARRAVRELDAP
ncbi:MAG: RND efflux system, inner membrane transporter, partial [uncultured Gemmatimonadaceae bacterium]